MCMNLRLDSFGIGLGPMALLRRWYSNKLSMSIKLVDLSDLYTVINESPPWGLSIRQRFLRYSNSNS